MNYLGIDLHKRESQVAVVDEDGEVEREVRVENANLDGIGEEYAGSKAAIEATGNYFTIYDTLDEHLDVVLANPLKTRWIAEADQKTDRVDAKKLAQLLRVNMVAESYVPPDELRKGRALARGRKKVVEKRTDCKNEVHAILDQNGITYDGKLWTNAGREFLAELALEDPAQLLLDQWLSSSTTSRRKSTASTERSSASLRLTRRRSS
jgi:transposase